MMVNGQRQWAEFDDVEGSDEDFEQIRQDYMQQHNAQRGTDWQEGPVAYSASRLFRIRPLVDYAVSWIEQNRN
jgi:aminoglycoside 3-N-acetyltransferase